MDNFANDYNKLSCDDALHVNNLDLESLDTNVEYLDDLLDECIDEYIADTFRHSSLTCVHELNYLEQVVDDKFCTFYCFLLNFAHFTIFF